MTDELDKKPLLWRICYSICCLSYIGLILYLGRTEFDRVNDQYRKAGERLNPVWVKKSALMELRDECRKKSPRLVHGQGSEENQAQATPAGPRAWTPVEENACLEPTRAVVSAREEKLTRDLTGQRNRAAMKFVLFYVSFLVFFLVVPLILLYWVGVFFLLVFQSGSD